MSLPTSSGSKNCRHVHEFRVCSFRLLLLLVVWQWFVIVARLQQSLEQFGFAARYGQSSQSQLLFELRNGQWGQCRLVQGLFFGGQWHGLQKVVVVVVVVVVDVVAQHAAVVCGAWPEKGEAQHKKPRLDRQQTPAIIMTKIVRCLLLAIIIVLVWQEVGLLFWECESSKDAMMHGCDVRDNVEEPSSHFSSVPVRSCKMSLHHPFFGGTARLGSTAPASVRYTKSISRPALQILVVLENDADRISSGPLYQ